MLKIITSPVIKKIIFWLLSDIKLRKFVYENALKSPLFDKHDYSKSFFEAIDQIVK